MGRNAGDKLDDKAVLTQSKQHLDEKTQRIQLEFPMPEGCPNVQSEWVPADKLKGGVLIAWCDHVRDAVTTYAAEQAAEARRKKDEERPGMAQPSANIANHVPAPPAPADPDQYIKNAIMLAEKEAEDAQAALLASTERHTVARENLVKWKVVADGLGIKLGEDNVNTDTKENVSNDNEGSTEDSDGPADAS